MQMPKDYNEVTVGGNWTPLKPGGHKLVIKQVDERNNKNGNPMIVVSYDTTDSDVQPKYYTEQYKNDSRNPKKWSGVAYINVLTNEGTTSRQFKAFCTSVEESNNGFKLVWGDKFAASFTNKLVGGVFGEEEYLKNDGNVGTSTKVRFWRSIDKVMDAEIPEKKCLERVAAADIPDGFEEISDDDLPF